MELPLQSVEVDKLTQAFIEARKKFKPFKEDSKANYGGYVSIDEIKGCTNQALLDNGLSLTQTRTFNQGQAFLVTKLMHVSGQWQASYVPLVIGSSVKNIDQALGAAMSYNRRYELYGLFSFKGEESDPDASPDSHKAPAKEKPTYDNPNKFDNFVVKDWHIKELKELFNRFENPTYLELEYIKEYKVKDIKELTQLQQKEIVMALKSQL